MGVAVRARLRSTASLGVIMGKKSETIASNPLTRRPVPKPSVWELKEKEYADRIRTAWSKTIEGILEVGQALIEAKVELRHGRFEHLVKEWCPFGARSAQSLMAIARHEVISNTKYVSHLPASWGTLYDLSKFKPRELNYVLQHHWLKPDIPRKDVPDLHRRVRRQLRFGDRRIKPKLEPEPAASARPPSFRFWSHVKPDAVKWLSSLDTAEVRKLAEEMASVLNAAHEKASQRRPQLQMMAPPTRARTLLG